MRSMVVGASFVLVLSAGAERAEACGGFFCGNVPVVQSGEKIIFAVDTEAEIVEAIIQINYSGPAEDFAWLLPLQSAPEHVSVGTQRLFVQVDAMTAPRFQPSYEFHGQCRFGGGADAGAAFDAAAPAGGGGGVDVLSRQQVGAYDSVVLQGSDGDAVRAWLVQNGYRVTEEMMMSVVPYIAQGDVLMALKLRSNSSTGDIQPIALRMRATEACIPIRLTAIAAQEDMEITAVVLSNEGRAVPTNYLHVVPNWTQLNWVRFGANYRSLIGDAVDEAGGNAFTTEYSGSSTMFRNLIHRDGEYDLEAIRRQTTLPGVMQAVLTQSLNARAEMVGILGAYITTELLAPVSLNPAEYLRCPRCYEQTVAAVELDGGPIADEIRERIVEPDRAAQALFDRYFDLTRLYTLLSPEEMTIDPIFDFRTDLPNVSNVHTARLIVTCNADGMIAGDRIEVALPDGTRYFVDSFGNPVLATTPASAKIEDLTTGRVVVDNQPKIDEGTKRMLEEMNSRAERCSCDSASTGEASALGILVLLAGLMIGRRR